ncbi:hypothetical protein [Actinomyces faecalis]|uniref:hypothetical protein n=1 Tax=Actinomyces faecalis TaxID=2722820 RepID=UPI002E2CFBF5|nr:hypothetical protein [Actinomyces faecalis]
MSEPVKAAVRVGGLVTCGEAMSFYGLPDLVHNDVPHVAVPANRGRTSFEGVVVHREQGLVPGQDLVVSPARLAARLLRCAPAKEAIAVVDRILHQELATREEIAVHLRGNRYCAKARRLLARCSERSRSILESFARIELEDAGMQAVPGVDVPGVGEIDLLVEGRVDVETDGYAFHSERSAWRKDRWRDQQLLARGLIPLRLTYDDVMTGQTVPIVTAVLASWEDKRR